MTNLSKRAGTSMLALFVAAGTAMAQTPPRPAQSSEPATLQADANDGAKLCKLKPEEMLRFYRESAVHAVRFDKANDKIIASIPGEGGKRSEVPLDNDTFGKLAMSAAQIPQPGPQCPTVYWNSKFIVYATCLYSPDSCKVPAAAPK